MPGEGMVDDDPGGGHAEVLRDVSGSTLEKELLGLMQLELCDEDQPAVVPYEEVK